MAEGRRYVFYEMSPKMLFRLGLPPRPMPIRRTYHRRVVHDGKVELDLLLDELVAFVAAHPEHTDAYAETIGILAYLVGVERGRNGFHDAAEHYLSLGLAFRPDNASLRANHALALYCLERWNEAAAEFESTLALPSVGPNALLAGLAARAHAQAGRPRRGIALLEPFESTVPASPAFWDLLGDLRERAGVAVAAPATAAPARRRRAPKIDKQVAPVKKAVAKKAAAAAPPPQPAPLPPFVATHQVPVGGLPARDQPDASRQPVATLAAGLQLQVVQELGAWSEVAASNGWRGWVDGRRLNRLN